MNLDSPLVQAPMAGVSTPALAAAVSNAGALGSIAVGATNAAGARKMIDETRALTARPFNVNVFTHAAPKVDEAREAAWLRALEPLFAEFGATAPGSLNTIYKSFVDDPELLAVLIGSKPAFVSFHFGLPTADQLSALKNAGIATMATATSVDEARRIEAAGVDFIVAQGIEAGGHRGVFDPSAHDDQLGTFALTRLLVKRVSVPVIAAGGIMDGAGIAAALELGAVAAQLGTAFIACPESSADEAFRKSLMSPAALHTRFTSSISGRPARCLQNRFSSFVSDVSPADYPRAYDAGKQLHAAAKAKGEHGFGAQWAGQGAPLARAMPAAELVATMLRELREG